MNLSRSSRHRGRAAAGIGAVAIAAGLVVAVVAFAAVRTVALSSASVHLTGPSGKRTARIAVNGRGLTVYWLGGETTRHLLCTSSACLHFWPPVTVPRGAKVRAVGFKARMGTLHRRAFTQVTLNGHPVYLFRLDGGKRGVATGDGVIAFGGTWHVFKVSRGVAAAGGHSAPASGTPPMSTTPNPGY